MGENKKPKGKANAQGKAHAQGQAQPQEPVVSPTSIGATCFPKGGTGWSCIQLSQPMGQLGAQAVIGHLQSLVASDPKKNKHLGALCV